MAHSSQADLIQAFASSFSKEMGVEMTIDGAPLDAASVGRWVGRVVDRGNTNTRAGLAQVARAIESEAKNQLGRQSHAYGTPSNASAGGPPSLVSGTLRRSVTHSRLIFMGGGWETKVGTATGLFPYYQHRTPSSLYGKYLETGLRNGETFPWLMPAFKTAVGTVGATFAITFRGW